MEKMLRYCHMNIEYETSIDKIPIFHTVTIVFFKKPMYSNFRYIPQVENGAMWRIGMPIRDMFPLPT